MGRNVGAGDQKTGRDKVSAIYCVVEFQRRKHPP